MLRIDVHPGIAPCEPFEYWCSECHTMHLSFAEIARCSWCDAEITIKGRPGELDVDSLRRIA
jgi:DNA-directed RNA polymerase subunit RPC12/RpoP